LSNARAASVGKNHAAEFLEGSELSVPYMKLAFFAHEN
jgi:hypothetical protein